MPIPLVHRFDVVTSTNDVALDMARRGDDEWTIVVAASQSGGRGRRGRVWLDEPGACLLASAILATRKPLDRYHELSFVASLAVAECLLDSFGVEARLKWPNDVLAQERKIAGVLVETTQTPAGHAAVVGIGVNANQTSFPLDIAETATSLALQTGRAHDIAAVEEAVLAGLAACYGSYLAHGFEEILNRWRSHMWGLGKRARIDAGDGTVRATIAGLGPDGALLLADDGGRVHLVYAADSLTYDTATP